MLLGVSSKSVQNIGFAVLVRVKKWVFSFPLVLHQCKS
jgi:hypothetical protein